MWQPLPDLRHTKFGIVLEGVRLHALDQAHLPLFWLEKSEIDVAIFFTHYLLRNVKLDSLASFRRVLQ